VPLPSDERTQKAHHPTPQPTQVQYIYMATSTKFNIEAAAAVSAVQGDSFYMDSFSCVPSFALAGGGRALKD
jgi:hypothetical protein